MGFSGVSKQGKQAGNAQLHGAKEAEIPSFILPFLWDNCSTGHHFEKHD